MTNRLKNMFSKIGFLPKAFLLNAYFAGMAFFVMAWGFGQGFVEVGILMGVFSRFIIEPVHFDYEKTRFAMARCILFSVGICYLIAMARFTVNTHMFYFDFEPFSFGLIYALFHVPASVALRRIWKTIRRNKNAEK